MSEKLNVPDRSLHQVRVDEFMRLAKQDLPKVPIMPGPAVRKLRANIILEEAIETIEGLGFKLEWFGGKIELLDTGEPNLIETVDGCCDLRVVTTGTLSALGVADLRIQELVDENNLQKFGPGSYRRESDGKWMKPPGHRPPDIMGELVRLGYKA